MKDTQGLDGVHPGLEPLADGLFVIKACGDRCEGPDRLRESSVTGLGPGVQPAWLVEGRK